MSYGNTYYRYAFTSKTAIRPYSRKSVTHSREPGRSRPQTERPKLSFGVGFDPVLRLRAFPVERNSLGDSPRNLPRNGPILPTPRQFRRFLSYQDLESETRFQGSRDGFGAGSRSLGQGLLHRHACPLTTWEVIFVCYQQLRDDDFKTGPLPSVERTGSHSLRWPYRLVSEFLPRSCSEASLFVAMAGFGKDWFGLSQSSRASGRRPSEAGHFYMRMVRYRTFCRRTAASASEAVLDSGDVCWPIGARGSGGWGLAGRSGR